MNEVEVLMRQTLNAYEWTNKLLEAVSFDKWEILPDVVESNISWQVGHLIISHYYHSVMVIKGHQMDVLRKLPIKDYSDMFTTSAPILSMGKTEPMTLSNDLKTMQQKSIDVIGSLSVADLNSALVPTPTPHPIALTKFEAIDWNIKHTMYHCGQIGMISRIIDKRYDFGLRIAQ